MQSITNIQVPISNHQYQVPISDSQSPIPINFPNIQNYIGFAVILLLISMIGFGLYNQFFKKTATPFAYPAALTSGSRIISFQGRLTDSLGNPIIAPIDLTYKFYTVSTGGSPSQVQHGYVPQVLIKMEFLPTSLGVTRAPAVLPNYLRPSSVRTRMFGLV